MHKFETFDNGLSLITAPMSGTKTVTALVVVGTGSKYEDKKAGGISHFLEHMFFKGTVKRPSALAISAGLDSIGAEYNAFTSKEFTGYYIKTSADKIMTALDVLSDMLLNPLLLEEEISREKGVIIEELNMYQDNPIMFIEDVFERLLYGDTPAGRDTIGTKETIAAMRREYFTSYLNAQYTARNTIICLAGDIASMKKKAFRNAGFEKGIGRFFAKKEFNSRGENFREKEAVAEKQADPQAKVHAKKTDQAHLSLGVRTFGYGHKDRIIIKLMSILLGGSMSSRLFTVLRERNGLAYYVRTEEEHYTDSGYLSARAGVPVDKLPQAVKLILHEYARLRSEPVGARELKRVKDMIRGRFALQMETSENVASWYARQAVLFKTLGRTAVTPPDIRKQILSPEIFLAELSEVTAADIKRAADQVFRNERLNLAIIGPYEDGEKFGEMLYI